MNEFYVTDEVISELVDLIKVNKLDIVSTKINILESEYPADERIHYLRHALNAKMGLIEDAVADLWSCMDIKPKDELFTQALSDLLIANKSEISPKKHDLQLTSGERQTAASIEKIRADHTARYKLAASLLLDKYGNCSNLKGLDLFCGNGYGSRLIHDQTGARMLGIDGSSEAVQLANESYGSHRTIFTNHYFPFEIREKIFDFTICYESIEHLEDYKSLLSQAINSSRGSVFISVPSEENLPFLIHKKFFKFHYRHFTINEILNLCSEFNTHYVSAIYGQLVYEIIDNKIVGLIPQEKMYMRPTFNESQFHILHLEPRG